MDAIILAGGFGTRLRSVVSDLPKPMAPIDGRPFLDYLLNHVSQWQVGHVILATGHLHEKIKAHYGEAYKNLKLSYSVEREPLGTGGCIKRALTQAASRHVLILNGDTFFDVDINTMLQRHQEYGADLTIALKPMRDLSRYGVVRFEDSRITSFEEKKEVPFGHINGGVYLARKDLFARFNMPEAFSLEQDFLKRHIADLNIRAFLSDTYFIDIGVPADYDRAQKELPRHDQSPVS